MTAKLIITCLDKLKNAQHRYQKYLKVGDSFGIGFQKKTDPASALAEAVEYRCRVHNKDGHLIINNPTDIDVYHNGRRIGEAPLQDGDVVWLTHTIHLMFKMQELSGAELYRDIKSSDDPIILQVETAADEPQQTSKEAAADSSSPVGQVIDGYRFEDVLNYGNMGVVYKGLQISLNRPVVIKALSPQHLSNPTMLKRFMNMANISWRLNHPYIVQIYDTGVSHEFRMHYVVMEYVEGETLQSLLEREKKLEIEHACRLMSQLASALAFAHKQNIIHRDVNPSNVILTKHGYIKLIGLALSKIVDPKEQALNLTVKGQAMGTMGYISPEQARSAAEVDFRTDIYSLGVIFYELLCGESPYEKGVVNDPAKYMKALKKKPKAPPHKIVATIPESLSNVIMKCMEPEPSQRFQHADDLLQEIKSYTESISLAIAQKRIRAMFPKTPDVPGYDFHVTFEPMEEIGGDFYDFVKLDEAGQRWGIVIGDVTGHGVEAAVVMGMVKSIVKLMAKNLDSAAEVLEYANQQFYPDMDGTTFVTTFYAILDTQNHHLRFARAGHNPLILYNPERTPALTTFAPKGAIMGVPWGLNCEEVDLALMPGDVFLQYTDGITEAKSKTGEEFGMDRLYEVVEQAAAGGVKSLARVIQQKVEEFSRNSGEDSDDITMVLVQMRM